MASQERGSLSAASAALKEATPESGVNLCIIDALEMPPDNLSVVENYDTVEEARQAVVEMDDDEKDDLDEFLLVFPNGEGHPVDSQGNDIESDDEDEDEDDEEKGSDTK